MSNHYLRKGYFLIVPILAAFLLVIFGNAAQAEDAQWRTRFWNNKNFHGDPVVERHDNKIDFDWGDGAPDHGVNSDDFSAKWNRHKHFEPGTYRFTATMDDAMRVYLDGNVIIDSWWDSQQHTMTKDVYVEGGGHDVKVEYYEAGGKAVAKVHWDLIHPEGHETGSGGGHFYPNWKGEYFNNTSLAGVPALVRDDRYLDHNWGTGSPAPGVIGSDNFSARWTRSYASNPGNYHISVTSDDGSRLYINNQLVVDNWGVQGPTTKTASYYHAGGNMDVRVEYFDQTQGASIEVHLGPETTAVPVTIGQPAAAQSVAGTAGGCGHPTGFTAYVTVSSLNFRQGPSTAFPVMAVLGQCDVVQLTGFTDPVFQWVQVVLPDGQKAWANNKYLAMGVPINQLSVLSD
jgi:hypothetical protein